MYKCPFCDKKFKRLFSLPKHIRYTHIYGTIYCPYCNLEFETYGKFLRHLENGRDKMHLNLYNLLIGKHLRYVDKEVFLSD